MISVFLPTLSLGLASFWLWFLEDCIGRKKGEVTYSYSPLASRQGPGAVFLA